MKCRVGILKSYRASIPRGNFFRSSKRSLISRSSRLLPLIAKQIFWWIWSLSMNCMRSSLLKSAFLLWFRFIKKALITSFTVIWEISFDYIFPKRSVKIHWTGLKSSANVIVSIILISRPLFSSVTTLSPCFSDGSDWCILFCFISAPRSNVPTS